MEKANNLFVVRLSQSDFLRKIEMAIPSGCPVLMENIQENLDPSLEPVLLKQVYKKSGQKYIKIGSDAKE